MVVMGAAAAVLASVSAEPMADRSVAADASNSEKRRQI
ncbi:hypothetical protein I546_5603 [Mycobacterium kansasii 732]|nr:hypothetical protein I546_5603 [Mycobacterium kansasii 732]